MKSVILEIKDGFAAVLSDNGCIEKIKNNNYEVGQVIQTSTSKVRFTRKITVFAASAAAFAVLSVGTWAYASPYSYVSLDVNPSIEYTVNRFDRVIHVKAVNDDGEEILSEIKLEDLKNKTIEAALSRTINQISELGFFDGTDAGGIVIATSGKNKEKAEQLAQDLQESVEDEVAENGDNVTVEAISVGLERVEQARELGVTPGKLNLVEKLQAAATDPTTIILEEWLDKPVKDIMKATKDYKKAAIASDTTDISDEEEAKQSGNSSDNANMKEQKDDDRLTKQEQKDAGKSDGKGQKQDGKSVDREQKQNGNSDDKEQKQNGQNIKKSDIEARKDDVSSNIANSITKIPEKNITITPKENSTKADKAENKGNERAEKIGQSNDSESAIETTDNEDSIEDEKANTKTDNDTNGQSEGNANNQADDNNKQVKGNDNEQAKGNDNEQVNGNNNGGKAPDKIDK